MRYTRHFIAFGFKGLNVSLREYGQDFRLTAGYFAWLNVSSTRTFTKIAARSIGHQDTALSKVFGSWPTALIQSRAFIALSVFTKETDIAGRY